MNQRFFERYLTSAAEELESYLLTEQLFCELPLKPTDTMLESSTLTPGNILFSERIVNNPIAVETIEKIRSAWKSHWLKKVDHEFDYRLNEWKRTVFNLQNRPDTIGYKSGLRGRVILELLLNENESQRKNRADVLSSLDALLAPQLTSSSFNWPAELSNAFPLEEFAFLYQLPVVAE